MSTTVYEFPLNEKVRNYLRIEQLLKQIDSSANTATPAANVHFFEDLFTLLDLMERLDIRSDVIKDIDAHERNLVHWSQHPNINNDALQLTLKKILQLREALKANKRIGSDLKDDPFLASIRQRFAIPGGACAFDLPNLHFWMNLDNEARVKTQDNWRSSFTIIDEAINLTLSFLRERGRFKIVNASKGFFPGLADERGELVRVKLGVNTGCYPTLSGNKYRYALRFMNFSHTEVTSKPIETDIEFEIASC